MGKKYSLKTQLPPHAEALGPLLIKLSPSQEFLLKKIKVFWPVNQSSPIVYASINLKFYFFFFF